eukprot:tig00000802_g4284.t1
MVNARSSGSGKRRDLARLESPRGGSDAEGSVVSSARSSRKSVSFKKDEKKKSPAPVPAIAKKPSALERFKKAGRLAIVANTFKTSKNLGLRQEAIERAAKLRAQLELIIPTHAKLERQPSRISSRLLARAESIRRELVKAESFILDTDAEMMEESL